MSEVGGNKVHVSFRSLERSVDRVARTIYKFIDERS